MSSSLSFASGVAHLQIFHHLLELLQQLSRGVLGAVARKVLQPIHHVLQVALAEHRASGLSGRASSRLFFSCSAKACMKRSMAPRS